MMFPVVKPFAARIARAVMLVMPCWVAACGGNPVGPGPQPLTLVCPNSVVVEATSPAGAPATFNPPSPAGGRQPYTTQCYPASGSMFSPGSATVTCTARDADQQQASCTFTVEVRIARSLAKTRFLAFGDSITGGTVSPPLLLLDNPDSYPYKLQGLLRERYPTQDIVVSNQGRGGERLDEGVRRLPGVLDAEHPQVLLLLEGVIEVRNIPASTNARHLETMIRAARQRGIDVILATLLPVGAALEAKEPGIMNGIRALNAQIHRLANEFDLGPPVDLFALFETRPDLIGRDALHPTADGYTLMAGAWRDAIVLRYDTSSSTMTQSP